MVPDFNEQEKAVHYPPDRRQFIGLSTSAIRITGIILFAVIGTAWLQFLLIGLPQDPSVNLMPANATDIAGFPWWVILCHWVNFFFLFILIRSGLSILMDHPRLYWNNSCKPNSEWIRFTPLQVPTDQLWTAKDDARYISPLLALPGYRHTVGIARGVALHSCSLFRIERIGICNIIIYRKSLAAAGSSILADSTGCVERICTLCNFQHAT